MVIQRILNNNGEPLKALAKLGARNYNSQPKLEPFLPEAPRNHRIASREKKYRDRTRENY